MNSWQDSCKNGRQQIVEEKGGIEHGSEEKKNF